MHSTRLQAWLAPLVRLSLVASSAVLALLLAAVPADAHGNGTMTDPTTSHGPEITVYRSSSCDCFTQWGVHLAAAGFRIDDHVTEEIDKVKRQLGITPERASCHTAVLGDYVIEGHVPARALQWLLSERPDIRGLAVPGMPLGSPGMDVAGVAAES